MDDTTRFSLPLPVILSLYWLTSVLIHLIFTDPNPNPPPTAPSDPRAKDPRQDGNNLNPGCTARVPEPLLVRFFTSSEIILLGRLTLFTLPAIYLTLSAYFYYHPNNILSCTTNPLTPPTLSLVGILISLICCPLRLLCFSYLGSSFSFSLRPPRGGKLVTTGPYRYVRHPSYTTGYLGMLGFYLAFFTPGTVIARCLLDDYRGWVGFVVGPGILLGMGVGAEMFRERIKGEERLLESVFGDEWRKYKQRTWVVIPWVC